MSSTTTVQAPPPATATAPRRPTAPPTRHCSGEPRLQPPFPAHPPLSGGALTEDIAAFHPPVSRCQPRHRACHAHGDRAPGVRRAGQRASGPGHVTSASGRTEQAEPLRPGAREPSGPVRPTSQAAMPEGPKPCAGFGPCAV
jgi:hypothetical protein